MAGNGDKSKVLLSASVYDGDKGEWTPKRNIRNVRVIYVADMLSNESIKMLVLEGEAWDYTRMRWYSVYGELALQLAPDFVIGGEQQLYIPFDQLVKVEWFSNTIYRKFIIGERNDKLE